MDSQIYSKGSYNPTSGSHSSRPLLLPYLQQHPTHTSAPPLVQQGHPTPYMYPLPPPPPTSSAPQAPLNPMPVTTQSYAQLSYLYQGAQHNSQQGVQSVHRSSDQLPSPSLGQTYLPPSTVLPPPPPLPPSTTSQGQALYRPSFSISGTPVSVPLRKLESPGVLLPPPPPPSASSLVPYLAAKKDEAGKRGEAIAFSGQVLDHEGTDCSKMDPAVGDGGSAKGISIHYESSSPRKRVEPGSPLCANSDTEMEDDITQPEDDQGMNYSSQALYPGSNPNAAVLFNKEQLTLQHGSAKTNSTMGGPSTNLQTGIPVYKTSNSCVQLCQETDDDGSRQASSSPYSGRAKNVPESGSGDMYDPFLDSIEPPLNLSKVSTRVQEHEPASESDIIPKHSISSNRPPDMEDKNEGNYTQVPSSSDTIPRLSFSSNKPLDFEENTRGNDIGAVIPITSGDHEEFGESANGVAGVSLETDSPGSPDEVADSITKVGEDENAGKKSWEKMKDKEPRSMRLFKVVLTQFVKDLLKPSWRQGNMSKEAFKTIVKKTVDKVSSSMEGRRIPKSRAKIDRYIDSSQHKLTKLVMGYVDKYAKA